MFRACAPYCYKKAINYQLLRFLQKIPMNYCRFLHGKL